MSCDRGVRQSSAVCAGAGLPADQGRALWSGKQTGADLKTQIEQQVEQLAQLTDQARISAEMQRYMRTMATFHRYSLSNQLLILYARPDATQVAGYKTWQKLGRQVQRGEKGIPIVVPRPYRKETNNETTGETEIREGITFGVGHVFDIAQTAGEPLPAAPEWTNQGAAGAPLADALQAYATTLGIAVNTAELAGNTQGESRGGEIALRADLTPTGRAATLAHELAHEVLHQTARRTGAAVPDRATRELEAEATAYVICQHFGLETNAPNYLALWQSEGKALRARLERISGAARQIIIGIEGEGGLHDGNVD